MVRPSEVVYRYGSGARRSQRKAVYLDEALSGRIPVSDLAPLIEAAYDTVMGAPIAWPSSRLLKPILLQSNLTSREIKRIAASELNPDTMSRMNKYRAYDHAAMLARARSIAGVALGETLAVQPDFGIVMPHVMPPQFISRAKSEGQEPVHAFAETMRQLAGAYAVAREVPFALHDAQNRLRIAGQTPESVSMLALCEANPVTIQRLIDADAFGKAVDMFTAIASARMVAQAMHVISR